MSLCYRCEHRALNKESDGNHHPRHECGQEFAVRSCYMYTPVKPVLFTPNENDPRPIASGWMISARVHAVEMPKDFMELRMYDIEDKYMLYWIPKNVFETIDKLVEKEEC